MCRERNASMRGLVVSTIGLGKTCISAIWTNLVPRASVVEREVEGHGKGWLSHDQIFQYSRKICLATSRVLNFCNKFSKYIGKFGHVTISLCNGLLPHVPPQRPWERGCIWTCYANTFVFIVQKISFRNEC